MSRLSDLSNFCSRLPFCVKSGQDLCTFTSTSEGLRGLFIYSSSTKRVSLLFGLPIIKHTSIYLEPVFISKVFREYTSNVVPEEKEVRGYSGFNLQFETEFPGKEAPRILRDFDGILRTAGKWTMAGILKMLNGSSVRSLHFSINPKDLICLQNKGTGCLQYRLSCFVIRRKDLSRLLRLRGNRQNAEISPRKLPEPAENPRQEAHFEDENRLLDLGRRP